MGPSRRGMSRSLSTHLVRADKYEVGSEIWTSEEGEIWVLAEVISQENTILAVRRKSTGEALEIDLVRRGERERERQDGHTYVPSCASRVSSCLPQACDTHTHLLHSPKHLFIVHIPNAFGFTGAPKGGAPII